MHAHFPFLTSRFSTAYSNKRRPFLQNTSSAGCLPHSGRCGPSRPNICTLIATVFPRDDLNSMESVVTTKLVGVRVTKLYWSEKKRLIWPSPGRAEPTLMEKGQSYLCLLPPKNSFVTPSSAAFTAGIFLQRRFIKH